MRNVNYIDIPSLLEARKRIKSSNVIRYNNKEHQVSEVTLNKLKGKKYYIKTHGCQANIRDEETLSGLLSSLNMERSEDINEASIIVINTCAVRENANNKVYAEIGNIKHLKEKLNKDKSKDKNQDLILILCGCMVETKDTLDKLINVYPYIDIILGTHNIDNLITLIDSYLENKGKNRLVDVSSKEGDVIEDLPTKRNNDFSAYVNIAFGCDKFCSYCIVPYTRGKERSRRVEDILLECKLLKEEGYKEVILLGQNVDSYGKDLKDYTYKGNRVSFATLLEEVAKLNISRVRFLTSYPSEFKDEVIDVIAKYDNVMNYIHLPVQSGSNSVLKRMNRRYTKEEYLALVDRIKAKIPNIALSTDIIIGFPNESNEEFLDTLDLVRKVSYSSAFTFIYSPREGTLAAKMEDLTPYQEKVKRFKELTRALEEGIEKDNLLHLNKIEKVLVTGVSKTNEEYLSGQLENNKIVNFKGDKSLIGKLVKVRISEDKLYSFNGELVED